MGRHLSVGFNTKFNLVAALPNVCCNKCTVINNYKALIETLGLEIHGSVPFKVANEFCYGASTSAAAATD
jgi:hypothetical protein